MLLDKKQQLVKVIRTSGMKHSLLKGKLKCAAVCKTYPKTKINVGILSTKEKGVRGTQRVSRVLCRFEKL